MDRPAELPPGKRWRCSACGNLTRFDVTSTELVRRYWHFDLAGSGAVEEHELLTTGSQAVTCRWCGTSDTVTVEDVPAGRTEASAGMGTADPVLAEAKESAEAEGADPPLGRGTQRAGPAR